MRDELGYIPDPCVEPAILDMAGYHDTTVRSSHGVGKTAAGSAVMLTAMCMTPNLVTIQLAPTWTQVTEVFWNEVRKWMQKSPIIPCLFDISDRAPKMWCRYAQETWYARGLSSSRQGNVEGRHNQNVLLIVDEAKAVEDNIIEGVQGALTSAEATSKVWRIYLSTPSTPGGKFTLFYKSHTKHKARWKTHRIPASESPRVSDKWVNQMIADWGIDSQIVQARVFGNFPEGGDDILIPLQAAESFYQPDTKPTGVHGLGVDVARYGNDESVISVWQSNTLVALYPFEKKSVMQVSQKVLEIREQYDAKIIVVDDIGVGGGVTDVVASNVRVVHDIHVVPLIVSQRPKDASRYRKLGDEIWHLFAQDVKNATAVSLVQDDVLEGQLSSYKITYSADNRIVVEWPTRKEDRMGSDSKSPDRADAVVMGWYAQRMLTGAVQSDAFRKEILNNDNLGSTLGRGILKRNF